MADLQPDDFRKVAQKYIDQWHKDVAQTLKKVDAALAEIDRIQKLKVVGPEDKKKLSASLTLRDAAKKAAMAYTDNLQGNLRRMKANGNPTDLAKLDGWLGDSLRLGAISFTKNIGLIPNKSILDKKEGAVRVPFTVKIRF